MKSSFPAFLGVAVGDAAGFGVEFVGRGYLKAHGYELSRGWIDLRQELSKVPKMAAVPGQYSDDTEHTIGLAKALMSGRPFTEDLLLEHWKAEYEAWQGLKTLDRGHGSIKKWYHGEQSLEEIRSRQQKRDDPGNAPTMRAVPLGFLKPELIEPYAWINTNTTHPHPRGAAAGILIAHATQIALKDGDFSNVFQVLAPYMAAFPGFGEELHTCDQIGPPDRLTDAEMDHLFGEQNGIYYFMRPDNSYKGLLCKAFKTAQTVLYVLKHARDSYDALQIAIHLGGDVDSSASVATGIMALRDGLDFIPSFMLEEVEGRTEIEILAQEFDQWRATHPEIAVQTD